MRDKSEEEELLVEYLEDEVRLCCSGAGSSQGQSSGGPISRQCRIHHSSSECRTSMYQLTVLLVRIFTFHL